MATTTFPRQSSNPSLISTQACENLTLPDSGHPVKEDHYDASKPVSSPQKLSWKHTHETFLTSLPLALGDVISVCTAVLFATACTLLLFPASSGQLLSLEVIAASGITLTMGLLGGLYPGIFLNPIQELRLQSTTVVISWLIVLVLSGLFGILHLTEQVAMLFAIGFNLIFAPLARSFTRGVCQSQSWWGKSAIVVGANPQGHSVCEFIRSSPQLGLKLLGTMDRPDLYWQRDDSADENYLGSLDEIPQFAMNNHVSWVIVAAADYSETELAEVVHRCSAVPNLLLLTSNTMLPSLWTQSRECGGVSGIHVRDQLLLPIPRLIKRTTDLLLASVALLLLSPLWLTICLIIKWKSPGKCLYGHERIGRGGRRFKAWKFRSMVANADEVLAQRLASDPDLLAEWEEDQKLKEDPRIIPGIGHFLRSSSLDELPQFWNVLRGEMSLVGPRPIVESEIEKYDNAYPLYLMVRPGLSGLWQISGRNNTTYAQRVQFDIYYVRNWSSWLDLFIMVRTIKTVLLREGAY